MRSRRKMVSEDKNLSSSTHVPSTRQRRRGSGGRTPRQSGRKSSNGHKNKSPVPSESRKSSQRNNIESGGIELEQEVGHVKECKHETQRHSSAEMVPVGINKDETDSKRSSDGRSHGSLSSHSSRTGKSASSKMLSTFDLSSGIGSDRESLNSLNDSCSSQQSFRRCSSNDSLGRAASQRRLKNSSDHGPRRTRLSRRRQGRPKKNHSDFGVSNGKSENRTRDTSKPSGRSCSVDSKKARSEGTGRNRRGSATGATKSSDQRTTALKTDFLKNEPNSQSMSNLDEPEVSKKGNNVSKELLLEEIQFNQSMQSLRSSSAGFGESSLPNIRHQQSLNNLTLFSGILRPTLGFSSSVC